jgi:RNA polymerase sigma-70 factor (ECF subfamily)
MKAHTLSDQALLLQYQNGDETALETLIHRYKDKVFTAIFVMVRDKYLAEDLFQEVFIKAINKLRSGHYNEEGKFGSWLLRIAHNHCIDYFRKVKNAPGITVTTSSGEDVFKFIGEEDVPPHQYEEIETKESKLKSLIEQLPPDQREVVILRHFYDFSFKEIAAYTNVSINTALGRMRYALINLRKIIEREKVEITW